MSPRQTLRRAAHATLDPSDVDGVLSECFYNGPDSRERPTLSASPPNKPAHYRVICISMYTEDLKSLDTMVDQLKARGLTKANRSALIRYALSQVDLARVPRGL